MCSGIVGDGGYSPFLKFSGDSVPSDGYISSASLGITLWKYSGDVEQGYATVNVYAASGDDVHFTSDPIASYRHHDNYYIEIPLSGSQANLLLAAKNGVYVRAVRDDGHEDLIQLNNFGTRPFLKLSYTQSVVIPTATYPTGNIVKGGTYRFKWKLNKSSYADDSVSVGIEYKVIGGESTYKQLADNSVSYDFDTSVMPGIAGMQWRIGVYSPTSGKTGWSDWTECDFSSPSLSILDLYPTGTVYHGFQATFRWKLSAGNISGAISQNITQSSAELQYRKQGDVAWETLTVSGDAQTTTLSGDNLPIGTVEWRIVAHTNVGFDGTSSWQSITNSEIAVSISGMYPGADGHAVKAAVNRFGWVFSAQSEEAPGEITQQSAVFYWRASGQGDYKSVPVDGSAQYVDIPAGTFASDYINWYVVGTASTGTSATSDIITVSTLDTLSTSVALRPAGTFEDDSLAGIDFGWLHQNATGTVQCGWELSYSLDAGVSYKVLASGTDASSEYRAEAGFFAVGNIYWRVRTKNTDGAWGRYSDSAIFAVRRAPSAPVIVYTDQKSLTTLRWQSSDQTGYEIEIDGVSLGMRAGSTKSWQSNAALADGSHVLRVRVINKMRDVSPWSEMEIHTDNVPSGSVTLTARSRFGEVELAWDTTVVEPSATYILRDGMLYAKADARKSSYIDRASAGKHSYVVRVFASGGNYTDSMSVQEAPTVPYGCIGLLNGSGWMLLRERTDRDFYARNATSTGNYLLLDGHKKSKFYPTGAETVVHTVKYSRMRDAGWGDLDSLRGHVVVYKDWLGHLAIGMMETLPVSGGGMHDTVSLTITEVDTGSVSYDAL